MQSFLRQIPFVLLVLALGVSASGCIHRQTDLEWARSQGVPIQTDGSTVRGKTLDELEVMVEAHGVRRWSTPMDGEHVTGSPYGMRTHPVHGRRILHRGQDIPCRRFAPIYAVARGEIVVSTRSRTAGRYIEIRHEPADGGDVRTTYMHMSTRRFRREGRTVRRGRMIGRCGSTGLSTGPHLHFELKVDGEQVPPFSYVETSVRND